MFGKNKSQQVNNVREVKDIEHSYELKIKELETEHKLALKEKEFELKHFKDDEVKKLNESVSQKNSEIAVLKKENEMLTKITNLNADIIDIKSLVANLIDKLPTINLKNLTLNGNSDK